MCCATANRSRSARTHRASLSVDSFFFSNLENLSKENVSPLKDNIGFPTKPSSSTPLLAARPGPLRQRAQTDCVRHTRSKSFRIITKANVTSSGKPPLAPKAARKAKKSVKFSTVDTRGYNLIMSDHPGVTSGLAISLGWEHSPVSSLNIDEYEQLKNKAGANKCAADLVVCRRKRNRMLVKYGNYTERDVFLADRKKEMAERADFFGGYKTFDT